MRCEGCGARLPDHGGQVFCRCKTPPKTYAGPARPRFNASVDAPEPPYIAERLSVCQECPHREGDACGVLKTFGKPGVLMHPNGIPLARSICPDKRWMPYDPSWVQVVEPVEREIHPSSDTAVIMLAAGKDGAELAQFTAPAAQSYANMIGADFVLIDGDLANPLFPCADKFRIRHYARQYRRAIYVDADVLVRRCAVNLFDAVPAGTIGMTNVIDTIPQYSLDGWLMNELTELMRSQGEPILDTQHKFLWNSGVMVLDGDMVDRYFSPPKHPCPTFWCAEEHWCRGNIEKNRFQITNIPRTTHWCWHWDRDFESLHMSSPPFMHLAGMGQDVEGWAAKDSVWRMRVLRIMSSLSGE